MKKIHMPLLAGLAIAASTATLWAQAEVDLIAKLDADADGKLSYAEMVVGYPDLTEETFAKIDANQDGMADAEEVKAALEAEVLPAMKE